MGRWLTIENKRELIDKSAAEPGMTHSELARWSKRAFRLRKAPARNTVSDILKNASTIKKPEYGEGKRRKPLKAEQIREDVGGPALDVGLSVGWLTGFLKRHKLRYRPRHGEAGSADADVVREGHHAIQEITDCYDAHDTYNMDETGLYYAAAPGRNGSDSLPVLFIGKAQKPRCVGKKTAEQLGYLYRKSTKACMNSKIYQNGLLQLDKEMRAAKWHILLLVDNVFSHALGDMVLTNIKVQKLSANTTTYLQPLDAGVIASFKARFRSLQIDHGIERFEADANVNGQSAYKIDQLQAMQWSSLLWSSTEAKTVAHCWQKTGLATPLRGNDEPDEDGEDEGVEEGDADGEIVDLMLKVASISL
ncbi:Tigger transposable element-derived protein 6 [Phytophthora cinnamomi]|uniref:Tigger transposable element-derived protein 6 n=1 Tax=Phytophthora cinnamomi TaxID=4785 RepID=UPI003559E72D|nr:Tigger transposable element-derived protein 6 [Phytophthora cinnamomi]